MRGRSDYRACKRSFTRNGHFENLIEMGSLEDLAELNAKKARELLQEELSDEEKVEEVEVEDILEKEAKGWRYAPFVSANYGSAGVKDVVEIPKKVNKTEGEEEEKGEFVFLSFSLVVYLAFARNTTTDHSNVLCISSEVVVPDFSFDWHISYASISPLRLSIVRPVFSLLSSPFDSVEQALIKFLSLSFLAGCRVPSGRKDVRQHEVHGLGFGRGTRPLLGFESRQV